MCDINAILNSGKDLLGQIESVLAGADIKMPRVRTNRTSKTINFPAEGGTITRKDRALIKKLNRVLSAGRGQTPRGVINHNYFWDGSPSTITISMPL